MYIGRLDVSMMVKAHCINNCTKPATVKLSRCLVSWYMYFLCVVLLLTFCLLGIAFLHSRWPLIASKTSQNDAASCGCNATILKLLKKNYFRGTRKGYNYPLAYQVSIVIGNYPLGHWSGRCIFRAVKHPENSHALWNCIWIRFTLHKAKYFLQSPSPLMRIVSCVKSEKRWVSQSEKSKNLAYSQQGVALCDCPMHNQGDVKSCDLIKQIKKDLRIFFGTRYHTATMIIQIMDYVSRE